MSTIDKEQAAARLRGREEELRERQAELTREDSEMRDAELADYDQHPADQGTETFEQEKDASTIRMLEQQLRDVGVAQQRLEEGTYGICIDGGEEIPAARLEAVPEALRCIEHQNRYEAEVKARGGPTLDAY